MKKLIQFFKEEDGATAVEYSLMVALIAAIIIAAVEAIGDNTESTFQAVADEIGRVAPAATP